MGAGNFDRQPSSRPLPGKTTVVTMSASSQPVGPFGSQTYQIRLSTSSQPALVKVGDGSPTADTTSTLLGTNVVDYITVSPGQSAAVLQAGSAGSISITEMT